MEAAVDLKYLRVFPNGGVAAAAKRTRLAAMAPGVYRECLKNHAATLGGHALDGCGEFMPSPEADPADPTSLRCAACGCHRNFHRRVHELPPSPPLLALPPPPPPPPMQPPAALAAAPHVMRGEETPDDRLPAAYDDDTEESDEGSDFDEDRPLSPLPPVMGMGPPGYRPAEPHMLVALGTGGAPGAQTPAVAPRPPAPTMPAAPGAADAAAAAAAARKRFRTKFSPEQKQRMQALSERLGWQRMQALSERLGWRLQKRDEAVVHECCREIGVTKGVFKVWMHNNKHNFVAGHSARRSASTAAATTTHPSSQSDAAAVHRSAPAAAASAHTSVPAAAPAPPPPAPVHSDFNINTTAADYFRVQPSTASVGSPQSS